MHKMLDENNEYREIYDHSYKGSSTINIASHFKDYIKLIEISYFNKHYENQDKGYLIAVIGNDVNEEKYDLLTEYCNVHKLTVDGELGKMSKTTFEWLKDPSDPSIINNVRLQTVKATKRRKLLKYHQLNSKYRSEKSIIYDPLHLESQGPILAPETDILIYVRVYVPFTSRFKQSDGALGKLSVDCVIAILGSQTLDKLKDQINCISDYSISREMSKAPIRQTTENAKNIYKSGFFFIENTFYNDFRDPKNKDNSKVVRDWAAARNFGTYKTAKMEETRMDSLILRFGFPWVYQHQGDCEHLISFSDARLVNPSDELNAECYPRIVRIKPKPNRYCMTCGMYSANWVTKNNNRLPHNPCLFCDSCFKSYNYIKGKKVGSFKAYPYPYDSNLLPSQLEKQLKMKPSSDMLIRKESPDKNSDCQELIKAELIQANTS